MQAFDIAIAQLNPIVGDIIGNLNRLKDICENLKDKKIELLITTECYASGYPPEDLVLKPFFMEALKTHIEDFAKLSKSYNFPILLGTPWQIKDKSYNAALLIDNGKITEICTKTHLPNYGVFDEKRVFSSNENGAFCLEISGKKCGILICEDMWHKDVAKDCQKQGAEILITLNASPFELDKTEARAELAQKRCKETGLPLIYTNQIGGQDELVFDGGSFALSKSGKLLEKLDYWQESTKIISIGDSANNHHAKPTKPTKDDELSNIYQAMMLGLRDYTHKNGFTKVILGLSGGIDSALSAAVAVDALGAENVHCVMMPSPHTGKESLDDARDLANNFGIKLDNIPISDAMQGFDSVLEPKIGEVTGLTAENIQPRIRALILMAISNSTGAMLLTTGNKSEMSVGYATLYGDMCGGFSVLKDLYKTTVFALSEWRNINIPKAALGAAGIVIPKNTITKPPTAELKPDQKDEDSLPPYEILDDILYCLIEKDMGLKEIEARGHDAEIISHIWRLLDLAEYKRRQAPPGVKISSRAFGRDRRYPITSKILNLLNINKLNQLNNSENNENNENNGKIKA